MTARHRDDLTIEQWRTEPQWKRLELQEPDGADLAPALWKGVTLGSIAAAALWIAAALLFS